MQASEEKTKHSYEWSAAHELQLYVSCLRLVN